MGGRGIQGQAHYWICVVGSRPAGAENPPAYGRNRRKLGSNIEQLDRRALQEKSLSLI